LYSGDHSIIFRCKGNGASGLLLTPHSAHCANSSPFPTVSYQHFKQPDVPCKSLIIHGLLFCLSNRQLSGHFGAEIPQLGRDGALVRDQCPEAFCLRSGARACAQASDTHGNAAVYRTQSGLVMSLRFQCFAAWLAKLQCRQNSMLATCCWICWITICSRRPVSRAFPSAVDNPTLAGKISQFRSIVPTSFSTGCLELPQMPA